MVCSPHQRSARPIFVLFRRAVRTTHGRASREYRELLDRRGGEDIEDDDEVTTDPNVAAGPTPG